jgi:hypothetical protein
MAEKQKVEWFLFETVQGLVLVRSNQDLVGLVAKNPTGFFELSLTASYHVSFDAVEGEEGQVKISVVRFDESILLYPKAKYLSGQCILGMEVLHEESSLVTTAIKHDMEIAQSKVSAEEPSGPISLGSVEEEEVLRDDLLPPSGEEPAIVPEVVGSPDEEFPMKESKGDVDGSEELSF